MSERRKRSATSHEDEKNGKHAKTYPKETAKDGPSNPCADTSLPTDPFVSLGDNVVKAFVEFKSTNNGNSIHTTLDPLSDQEIKDLERVFEFYVAPERDEWRDDWGGNIAYFDKDVANPKSLSSKGKKASSNQTLISWAQKNPFATKWLYNLLRYVYHMKDTPNSAKAILSTVDASDVDSIQEAVRRLSYDPDVLRDDGWVTKRVITPVGATGGAYHIASKIRWKGFDAVIIAYVHDSVIGDLWKGFWIDDQKCFDLEYEEVLDAKRKWERKYMPKTENHRKSARCGGSSDFSVPGARYGIVLAASFSRGARQGVFWPARIMHASEKGKYTKQGKRNNAKLMVDLMFLAPYWISVDNAAVKCRTPEGIPEMSGSTFSAAPLFHLESVDATDEMIKEYYFGANGKIDINELQMSFRFTGLPKDAFTRYVDSHRLAMGLRLFAKNHLSTEGTSSDLASAGLFDTHIMSIQAPQFPRVVLELPFVYILDQINRVNDDKALESSLINEEQPLQLHNMVKAMEPPMCWGLQNSDAMSQPLTNCSPPARSPFQSHEPTNDVSSLPPSTLFVNDDAKDSSLSSKFFQSLAEDLPLLKNILNTIQVTPTVTLLRSMVTELLNLLSENSLPSTAINNQRTKKARIKYWLAVKRTGVDILSQYHEKQKEVLTEWKMFIERVYRKVVSEGSGEHNSKGVSLVLSDYRCNGHRTSDGCFERAVRLPAAIKGARLAGAGTNPHHRIISEVDN